MVVLFGHRYCLSFLFNDHASAQNVMLLIYINTGAVLPLVIYILGIIPSTQATGRALRYVFRFVPNYSFSEIIQNEMTRTATSLWGSERTLWDIDITGESHTYFFFSGSFECIWINFICNVHRCAIILLGGGNDCLFLYLTSHRKGSSK
jgi:hypothetical protein